MMSNAEKFQVSVITLLVTVVILNMAILKVARWPRLSLDLGHVSGQMSKIKASQSWPACA